MKTENLLGKRGMSLPVTQNQYVQPAMGGFFGNLWGKIKENMGSIAGGAIGGMIGGPIGILVGYAVSELIDSWTSVDQQAVSSLNASRTTLPNLTLQTGGTLLNTAIDTGVDEYPLSDNEESLLLKWFDNEFKPTIITLANSIDAEIEFSSQSRMANGTTNVIEAANGVLRSISIIRANNAFLLKHGELVSPFGTAVKSWNYSKNKLDFSGYYLDILEKAVLSFLSENGVSGYELIARTETVSTVSNVESVVTEWRGQKVDAPVQRMEYVEAIKADDVIVQVVDLNVVNVKAPATTTPSEIPVKVNDEPLQNLDFPQTKTVNSAKSNTGRYLLVGLLSAAFYKLIRKK